jgi:CheY-like chemotaxis protein
VTLGIGAPLSPARPELRILLIEDSVLIQARLTQILAEPGVMRVAGLAATEREARQCIDGGTFDVLLVDVALREGSGIGVIAHARAVCAGRQPLIIVLTNYPLPAVRQRCMAAGADHFLDKIRQFQDVKPLIAAARPAGD